MVASQTPAHKSETSTDNLLSSLSNTWASPTRLKACAPPSLTLLRERRCYKSKPTRERYQEGAVTQLQTRINPQISSVSMGKSGMNQQMGKMLVNYF